LDEIVFDLVGLLHAHVGDGELTRVPLRKPEADAPMSRAAEQFARSTFA
jgi:hypothetical protein